MILLRCCLLLATCCLSSGFCLAAAAPEFSPDEAVAVVDGVPVTRATLYQTLEGLYGEQTLPQLIDNQLLANALTSRGLNVSNEEVNIELARIQEQDSGINDAVEAGGARVAVIRGQVRRNLTIQKILTSRIANPTSAQLQAFFSTYASYYNTPAQNRLGILATSTKARRDQLTRALKANPGAFSRLVDEQKKRTSTDLIGGQSVADVGRFETPDEFATTRGIPPQIVAPLIKALASAKKGQLLAWQAFTNEGPYILVKVVDRKEAVKPTLAQLKPDVETDYKMAQVALAEIKKNPQNPPGLAVNLKMVMQLLSQPNPQTGEPSGRPTLRDALTFILRPAANNSLSYLRSHATVTTPDSFYNEVRKQYQKLP